MNQSLLIDNIAFAKRSEHLAGVLSLSDCKRLSELLESQHPAGVQKKEPSRAGLIEFSLTGETNAVGQCFLHLAVTAKFTTFCQRCLEEMPLDLNLNFDYLITHQNLDDLDGNEVEDIDEYDLQEASQSMDVGALIEDEVMMALPIAPTHANACGADVMQSGEKPNPFAVLKGLIKP